VSDETDTETAQIFAAVADEYMAAFNAGDVAATVGMYTADGVSVIQPGVCVSKADGTLQAAFERYFATTEPRVDFTFRHVYVAGEVALGVTEWTIKSQDQDGRVVREVGRATDVLRRAADGAWRFAIDNRYGSSPS
jgi:uncharacterized protein (TIGR02246 family)